MYVICIYTYVFDINLFTHMCIIITYYERFVSMVMSIILGRRIRVYMYVYIYTYIYMLSIHILIHICACVHTCYIYVYVPTMSVYT